MNLGSLRSCHPLDFISGFLKKGNIVVSQVTMCLTYLFMDSICLIMYMEIVHFFVFFRPTNVSQLGKAADDHVTWAKQTYLNVTESLVPDGLKLFRREVQSPLAA